MQAAGLRALQVALDAEKHPGRGILPPRSWTPHCLNRSHFPSVGPLRGFLAFGSPWACWLLVSMRARTR